MENDSRNQDDSIPEIQDESIEGPPTVPFTVRITKGLRADLDELAKADRRTTANYAKIILEDFVAEKKRKKDTEETK